MGQVFRVSEKLMTQVVHWLSNNGNMLTNMIGSSSLKSTDHTSQVKPGHLSDRFILKRELHMDDISESESEFESDFEEDWESCVSSVEER